jgi:hypothetical protein
MVAIVAQSLNAAVPAAAAKKTPISLAIKKIYFEYNSTASALGDLGVHVFLDGEDWKELKIVNPKGRTIFEVEGKGPYKELGMTELFFEGAEPDLGDVPLQDLLDRFPAGDYKFLGKTVDGERIVDTSTLTHAIPAGPSNVSPQLGSGNALVISWDRVTGPPSGFPNQPINIVAYQVIVGDFQVTVPATSAQRQSVTVSPEFVGSLASGPQPFEVLAIEAGGNQTITEGVFMKP